MKIHINDSPIEFITEQRTFMINYIYAWFKKNKFGHYKYINIIMSIFFENEYNSFKSNLKAQIIETEYTINYLTEYLCNITNIFLQWTPDKQQIHFTEYFNTVYLPTLDIWGFIMCYIDIAMYLYTQQRGKNIIKSIRSIFIKYLFTANLNPIDIKQLTIDLKSIDFNDSDEFFTIEVSKQSDTNTNNQIDQTEHKLIMMSGINN